MPKRVKYNGKWYEVLEEKEALRSNEPAVKTAYRISDAAWIMNTEVEEILGQDDTQTPGQ